MLLPHQLLRKREDAKVKEVGGGKKVVWNCERRKQREV